VHLDQRLGGEETAWAKGQVSEGVCSWTTKLSQAKKQILKPINYVPEYFKWWIQDRKFSQLSVGSDVFAFIIIMSILKRKSTIYHHYNLCLSSRENQPFIIIIIYVYPQEKINHL
jgi:hypothetical protein